VVSDSIDPQAAQEWFVNVNDRTCEGILYRDIPVFSVQFHPEACGGPRDTAFLFDQFMDMMEVRKHASEPIH
jgi:carbamoyl-phosphate synthase small subunit